ncbi:MAG TPA: TetR/AcrR family transcriptional regulator [Gaiellaceae bacterium]|jgi:AcrR family transcriptional regulator
MSIAVPPLRSDAQRNLERILAAASEIFREVGPDASVAEVAERAGVGTATIFRRFPTKSDLIGAVVEAELTSLLTRVEEAVSGDDPGAALTDFVATAVESYVGDRCLCDTVGGELFERPRIAALAQRLLEALDRLVRHAQRAGAIRKDVTAADIAFFVRALGQAGSTLERTDPGAWRRYVAIVLDGLRAPAR